MEYRKQTQHIRRYRSGRWTCVNRGIKYSFFGKGSRYQEQAKKLESAGKLKDDEFGVAIGIAKPTSEFSPDREAQKHRRAIIQDGVMVGAASFESIFIRGKEVILLKNLYIIPEMRKQGIGTKVIENLFKNPKILAISGTATQSSKEFWRKMGATFDENPSIMYAAFDHYPFTIWREGTDLNEI